MKSKNQNEQMPALPYQDFEMIMESTIDLLKVMGEINLQNTMEELNQVIFGLTNELKKGVSQSDFNAFDVANRLGRIETYSNLMCFVAKVLDQAGVLDRQVEYISSRKEASNESK